MGKVDSGVIHLEYVRENWGIIHKSTSGYTNPS
jgi:hypothetical protein